MYIDFTRKLETKLQSCTVRSYRSRIGTATRYSTANLFSKLSNNFITISLKFEGFLGLRD